MVNYKAILFENKPNSSIITLNRPEKHNAINSQLINEITEALKHSQLSNSRCIIIKANGSNFCAGADLTGMQKSKHLSTEKNHQEASCLAQLFQQIADCPKPIIAVVQGRAMGGACGIVAACDFVIASQKATFCFSEVKLGLVPATIAPYVVRRIGYQAARRYFLSADLMSAERAHAIQLIDFICQDNDAALAQAGHLAAKLVKNGPTALATTKALLAKLCPIDSSTIDDTIALLADVRVSDEAQEGLLAFFDKRNPSWCQHDK